MSIFLLEVTEEVTDHGNVIFQSITHFKMPAFYITPLEGSRVLFSLTVLQQNQQLEMFPVKLKLKRG